MNVNEQYELIMEANPNQELEILKSKEIGSIIKLAKIKKDWVPVIDKFVAEYMTPDENLSYLYDTDKGYSEPFENILIDRLEDTVDRLGDKLQGKMSETLAGKLADAFKESDIYEYLDEYFSHLKQGSNPERAEEFYDKVSEVFYNFPEIRPTKDELIRD